MLLFWLLISSKQVLSCNWLATTNNFLCCYELKMWFLGALFEQKRFSLDNLTHVVFWRKGELFDKIALNRLVLKLQFQNPRKLDKKKKFLTIQAKQFQIQNGTKNRLNMIWHRQLGGIIRATNEIHIFFYKKHFLQLSLSVAELSHELSFKCCLGVA